MIFMLMSYLDEEDPAQHCLIHENSEKTIPSAPCEGRPCKVDDASANAGGGLLCYDDVNDVIIML